MSEPATSSSDIYLGFKLCSSIVIDWLLDVDVLVLIFPHKIIIYIERVSLLKVVATTANRAGQVAKFNQVVVNEVERCQKAVLLLILDIKIPFGALGAVRHKLGVIEIIAHQRLDVVRDQGFYAVGIVVDVEVGIEVIAKLEVPSPP